MRFRLDKNRKHTQKLEEHLFSPPPEGRVRYCRGISRLCRHPPHFAARKDVNVEVVDRLERMGARVDDYAEALGGKTHVRRHGVRDRDHVPDQPRIVVDEKPRGINVGWGNRREVSKGRDVFARHNEDVDGGHGVQIVEGNAVVVFVSEPTL